MPDPARWVENKDGSWTRRPTAGNQPQVEVPYVFMANNEPEATEAAAELAEELGVELADVEGTGSGGRITKADVEAAVQEDEE